MKREDAVMRILQALGEMDVKYPDGYGYEEQAEFLLSKIEEFMIPMYGGVHQSSFDLAMGSIPEWDK